MIKDKVFRYVCERSQSRSLGQNLWHDQNRLVTRNVHFKYESSTCNGSKVVAKVRNFINVSQMSWSMSQGHQPWCHLKGLH